LGGKLKLLKYFWSVCSQIWRYPGERSKSPKIFSLGNSTYIVKISAKQISNLPIFFQALLPPVAQLEYSAPGGKNIFVPLPQKLPSLKRKIGAKAEHFCCCCFCNFQ